MSKKKIKKAIFPVGGLGTRFLPATKSIPKEMLPVLDKPLVQYAVEEALEAGIEEFIFVTGREKRYKECSDDFDNWLGRFVFCRSMFRSFRVGNTRRL